MRALFVVPALSLALALSWVAPSSSVSVRAQQAPSSPSGLQIDLGKGLVTWVDNSDNEDGFRITITTSEGDVEERYREEQMVPANTTSVTARSIPDINRGDSARVSVVAFNAGGESAPAVIAISLEGGLTPPTPTASVPELPRTGAPSGSARPFTGVYLGLGATLLFLLGLWISRRRTEG